MAQATLINDKGVKVAVEAGSAQAQQYFGQGFRLMTSTTPTAPVATPTVPTGAVAIPGAKYNTRELQQANFDNIQPIGDTLYGIPKPLKAPGVSNNPDPVIDASTLADTSLNDQYQDALTGNYNLALKKAEEAKMKASTDDYSTTIRGLADTVRSNLQMTFTPEQQKQNVTDLLSKQEEIRGFNLATDKKVSDVDFNNDLLTSQGTMSKAQIEREASFKSRALSDQEANLISMVNLSRTERAELINGTKTIADYEDKIQTHINDEKQAVLDQAKELDAQAQTRLSTAIEAYRGIDPDTLTAEQTAQFSRIVSEAGLDPALVFAGIRVVNKQTALDNSLKSTQLIGSAQTGYYRYDQATGKKELVIPPVADTPSFSEKVAAWQGGYTFDEDGNIVADVSQASADDVANAIATVESGGRFNASGASGESGAFQFMPATWNIISQQYAEANGINQSLPMTAENEDKVARWKISQLLAAGNTPEQVALIWNGSLGGSEKAVKKAGTNSKGVAYDTGAYAQKVMGVLQNNLKSSVLGGGEKLTPAQMQSAITSIVGQFDNEAVVKNYNVTAEGYQFAKSITDKENPTSSDDQGLLYAFAKAMDPNSVVREGEYATVQKYAQSWAQTFGFNAKRIFSNSPFLSKEARQNMVSTIEAKYAVSEQSYNNIKSEYDRRIEDVQRGYVTGSITDYSKAWNSGSEAVSDYPVGTIVNVSGQNYKALGNGQFEAI